MFKLLTSDQWNKEKPPTTHSREKNLATPTSVRAGFVSKEMQERRWQPNVYLTKNVALTPQVR